MTPEERAVQLIEGCINIVPVGWRRKSLQDKIADAIRDAVTAAEERAQRAERELAALKAVFLDKPEDRLWHDSDRTWWKRTEKGLVSAEPPGVVAEMLALAEEGRKAVTREIIELVQWDRYGIAVKGKSMLTDKGRERLAFLRGLVGEKANDDAPA